MHDRSSDPFPASLAKALRQRREELGLNQVDLADLAGCSTRFVHTVEAGKGTLRLDKLAAVLQVLGMRFRVELGRGHEVDPRLLGPA